jgi:hypothetical protein
MAISAILAALPSRRTLLTVALSSLLGGAVAIGVAERLSHPAGPPAPPHDAKFEKIGREYLPGLGKAYAAAWEEGAKSLDAGQPLSASLAAVGKAWDANRIVLFDRLAAPELSRIVPESQKDADVTPAQRAAMSSAWRGLALGLGD